MAELHTWEEVEEKASEFAKRFGYEPVWYGHVDDAYDKLVESLETGRAEVRPVAGGRDVVIRTHLSTPCAKKCECRALGFRRRLAL